MKKIIINWKTIVSILLTILLILGVQGASPGFFDIVDVVEDIIDEGENVIEDVIDEGENVIEDIENTAEDTIDEGENTVNVIEDTFNTFEHVFVDVENTFTQIIPGITDIGVEIGATIKWNTGELKNIVTSSFDNNLVAINLSDHIQLWNPIRKEVIATLPYEATIKFIDISSDGLMLASANIDKTVQLWNIETQKLMATLKGHTDEVLTVAFGPDNIMLASAGRDKIVRLWNTETQKLIATLEAHTERVKSVAFSPDGSILASSGVDRTIRLWSTETQKLIATLEAHTRSVPHIIFSPDGSMLASASADGTVRIWDHLTEQVLATLDNKFHVRTIAFSPDGSMLAAGTENGSARVWNVATEEIIFTFKHKNPLRSVAFTSDGNTLITGSKNNIMQQWEFFTAITLPIQSKEDVNSDGAVNILDLVFVASQFGLTDENAADVNGNGIINIQDLILVANAFSTSAAAPSLQRQSVEMLTAADIQKWLSEASQLEFTDVASQRGILFLQQLLTTLTTPKKTELLANYPNPLNPETWIPYHLATPADVHISIYAVNGTLVRTLALGHQDAGLYQSRSRAAYWDGNNEFGEKVASGVYFYTLTAEEFTATRKMLIQK